VRGGSVAGSGWERRGVRVFKLGKGSLKLGECLGCLSLVLSAPIHSQTGLSGEVDMEREGMLPKEIEMLHHSCAPFDTRSFKEHCMFFVGLVFDNSLQKFLRKSHKL